MTRGSCSSVARDATDQEIKKAYRKESLLHHPDKVRISDHIFVTLLTILRPCPFREETRSNSSLWWRRTLSSQILNDERGMTQEKTKTV